MSQIRFINGKDTIRVKQSERHSFFTLTRITLQRANNNKHIHLKAIKPVINNNKEAVFVLPFPLSVCSVSSSSSILDLEVPGP